jgi:hypothetical protein
MLSLSPVTEALLSTYSLHGSRPSSLAALSDFMFITTPGKTYILPFDKERPRSYATWPR